MSYKLPPPPWDLIGTPRWEQWWDEIECPKCQQKGMDGDIPARAPHCGTYVCRHGCGYQTYIPKPRTIAEQKKRRPGRRFDQKDTDRCGCCGLTRPELEAIGRVLHDCHAIDRADLLDESLPPDDRENHKWLCNHCHEIEQAERRDAKRLLAVLGAPHD